MSDGGDKERSEGGWEERCKQNALSCPCLLYTPQTAQMPPTHPTATTPQPSGGTLEALWFVLSYCMRHEHMENYLRVIVPLGICLLNKKILSGGNGRDTSLRKTAFVLTKCSLGDAVWMSFLWTITGIHRTARHGWKPRENENAATMMCEALGRPPHRWTVSRLQSHLTAWHSIPVLRRGFISPDDGFFFKVMTCGLPKALSAPWATSISYNEWQFFLEIFNYGDTHKKEYLLTFVAEPPLQMFFIK